MTAYEIARSQFPNAKIKASKFEDFTAELQSVKSKLPVFTQEMGDVWIQGSGSDPRKTAEMRAMFRARALCFKQGRYTSSTFLVHLSCSDKVSFCDQSMSVIFH